jgi:single-strand DNA-binding protein
MNECHFDGNLTRDPEIRYIGAGKTPVVNFCVASSRKYKKSNGEPAKEVTFLECEAWDTGATTINEYFKKGDPIIVHCSAKTESWEDKTTGAKRSRIKFRVNKFEFPLAGKQRPLQDESAVPSAVPTTSGEDNDNVPF